MPGLPPRASSPALSEPHRTMHTTPHAVPRPRSSASTSLRGRPPSPFGRFRSGAPYTPATQQRPSSAMNFTQSSALSTPNRPSSAAANVRGGVQYGYDYGFSPGGTFLNWSDDCVMPAELRPASAKLHNSRPNSGASNTRKPSGRKGRDPTLVTAEKQADRFIKKSMHSNKQNRQTLKAMFVSPVPEVEPIKEEWVSLVQLVI